MPKLGWKDQMLYVTVLVLTGGFPIFGWLIVMQIQDTIAFSDPQVIAKTVGEGNMHCVWLMLWSMVVFVLIYAGPYQNRLPVFGRTDIKYGPPAYPRVFPVLMKNKPQYWVSPRTAQKKKQARIIVAILLAVTFFISAAVFPLSLHGRAVLNEDGTITVYDAKNREIHHYTYDEVTSVELGTYQSSGRYSGSWHIHFVIYTSDSKTYNFAAHTFSGTDLQQLQTMLHVKETLYGNQCLISGTENLRKVIQDQYHQADERALVYQLFELMD